MEKLSATDLSLMLGSWSGQNGKLAKGLATEIGILIESAQISTGVLLPSQRDLSEALGVSRVTVSEAFEILASQDLLAIRPGARARARGPKAASATSGRLASFTTRVQGEIDLTSGALRGSPQVANAFQDLSAQDLSRLVGTDGYYPYGLPELRLALARDLFNREVPTTIEQLLVTSGAQQALSICGHRLISPGDTVFVEDPTYRGAIEVFRSLGAKLIGVATDKQGMRADHLQRLLESEHPQVIYLQPQAHNPTGVSMSPARVQEIAVLLQNQSAKIIIDMCSTDLWLSAEPHTTNPLWAKIPEENLYAVGTASKLWWAGLRVGWIRASQYAIKHLVEIRKNIDLSGSPVDQLVCANLYTNAQTARQDRRNELLQDMHHARSVLEHYFPHWQFRNPTGGTGIWVDTGTDALRFTEQARRLGVHLAPGPVFSPYGGFQTYLRLPLGHSRREFEEAFRRLSQQKRSS